MTSSSRARLGLGILGGLALALSVAVQVKGRESAPPSPVPTIDNPGPVGLEAAFRYLGPGAHVLDAPASDLPEDARVLVTALPYDRVPGPEEREALWQWVARGGTLVVLGNHRGSLGSLVPSELNLPDAPLNLQSREVGLPELGADVGSLLAAAVHPEEHADILAPAVLPEPVLAGVQTLSVSAEHGFRPLPGATVPLVLAGDTPILEERKHGQGTALFFAGPDALANARLDRLDNLQLLANLGAMGPIYFDEYHHRPAATEGMAQLLRVMTPTLLQLGLLGAALVWSLGRRLGPIRTHLAEPTRTTRDYAYQLGALYKRAHAETALCKDLEWEYRSSLQVRLGLEPGASLERRAARFAGLDPQVARAAERFESDLLRSQSHAPTPEQFARLSRDWVALLGRL